MTSEVRTTCNFADTKAYCTIIAGLKLMYSPVSQVRVYSLSNESMTFIVCAWIPIKKNFRFGLRLCQTTWTRTPPARTLTTTSTMKTSSQWSLRTSSTWQMRHFQDYLQGIKRFLNKAFNYGSESSDSKILIYWRKLYKKIYLKSCIFLSILKCLYVWNNNWIWFPYFQSIEKRSINFLSKLNECISQFI